MRERDIEAHLVKRIKALGGEVRKVRWIGRRGAPDRLVMLPERLRVKQWDGKEFGPGVICAASNWIDPARTIWVELKAPGKKAEPHQVREHERMRAMGQRVVVIDSIEAIEELLA